MGPGQARPGFIVCHNSCSLSLQSTMSFSDGKIKISNVPADDKGKPNTLIREVSEDKLVQVSKTS